jgi:hypothetical protein
VPDLIREQEETPLNRSRVYRLTIALPLLCLAGAVLFAGGLDGERIQILRELE